MEKILTFAKGNWKILVGTLVLILVIAIILYLRSKKKATVPASPDGQTALGPKLVPPPPPTTIPQVIDCKDPTVLRIGRHNSKNSVLNSALISEMKARYNRYQEVFVKDPSSKIWVKFLQDEDMYRLLHSVWLTKINNPAGMHEFDDNTRRMMLAVYSTDSIRVCEMNRVIGIPD